MIDITPTGYGHDVSGALWNPITETLWTCENNPGVVRRSTFDEGLNTWIVNQSWVIGGDIEAITQRGFNDPTIFVGVERDENNHRLIREYETSGFSLIREWDLITMLSGSSNNGLEALTFVPDSSLAAMQFVDSSGVAYDSSQYGTGGLFFAGHQNSGDIYVFDLDRSTTGTDLAHVHVTTLPTGENEIAALEFDRTNGLLYAWHDASIDLLQVFGPGCCGTFTSVTQFDNPFCCNWNIEGLALVGNDGCGTSGRSLLFTRDQGGATDPSLYQDLEFPCDCNGNAVADPIDISSAFSTDMNQNGIPDECEPLTTSIQQPNRGSTGSTLHSNEPNPFNPSTVIAFDLAVGGEVTLSIYDVTGRRVRHLLNRSLPAGSHKVAWDGTDGKGRQAAGGVYLYRIEAGQFTQTRRMVLLK